MQIRNLEFFLDNWKPLAAMVYTFICLFDFVVVPAWIGLYRPSLHEVFVAIQDIKDLPPAVLLELAKAVTHQHSPFTLQFGGMFHIAFGALLTGAAISRTTPITAAAERKTKAR